MELVRTTRFLISLFALATVAGMQGAIQPAHASGQVQDRFTAGHGTGQSSAGGQVNRHIRAPTARYAHFATRRAQARDDQATQRAAAASHQDSLRHAIAPMTQRATQRVQPAGVQTSRSSAGR